MFLVSNLVVTKIIRWKNLNRGEKISLTDGQTVLQLSVVGVNHHPKVEGHG